MKMPKNAIAKRSISNLSLYNEKDCNTSHVYVLYCPVLKRIRYVGCTNSVPWARYNGHMADARACHRYNAKAAWIYSLIQQGLRPVMRLVHSGEAHAAFVVEEELIASISKRRQLFNVRCVK